MTQLDEIRQATAKIEEDLKLTKKSLLEAAKVIYRIRNAASAVILSDGDREQMVIKLLRDLLRIQIPEGVSYEQVMEDES